jgi:hypothetical protein
MRKAGVKVLAGSDLPASTGAPPPLHDELVALVRAGMTPLEALQATTRNAAEFTGRLPDEGTVEAARKPTWSCSRRTRWQTLPTLAELWLSFCADGSFGDRNCRASAELRQRARLESWNGLSPTVRIGQESGCRDEPVANSVPDTQPIPTRNSNSPQTSTLSVLTLTASSDRITHVEQATPRNYIAIRMLALTSAVRIPDGCSARQGSAAEPREEVRDREPPWRRA